MRPLYKIGDPVGFKFGVAHLKGTITEDRGPLGRGGERIYQILVVEPPCEPRTYEMREDNLERLRIRTNTAELPPVR